MSRIGLFNTCSMVFISGIVLLATGLPCNAQSGQPIKIGFISMFTGRVSVLGTSGFGGVALAAEEINSRGGLLGRKIELIKRDCEGKPEEAVRIARELVNNDKVNFIIDNTSSGIAFALKEAAKDLKTIIIITSPEAIRLNADPTIWSKYTFKTARSVVHDALVAASFMGKMAKEMNLKKWTAISPSYSYGQDWVELLIPALEEKAPDIKIGSQLWPKVYTTDFTPHITTIISEKPDGLFVVQWGQDAIAFVKQAKEYELPKMVKMFGVNFGEYEFLDGVRPVPEGMFACNRYLLNAPPTDENKNFGLTYKKKFETFPTCWSQESYTAVRMLGAAVTKAKTVETEAVIKALEGLTIKAPWGTPPNGTVTMRARDHQLVDYYICWGRTISNDPYVVDLQTLPWKEITDFETKYLKQKGWLK